jgi:uncharacterized protein YggE
MVRPALLAALLFTPAALAQLVDGRTSVTAEGSETVRLKPDRAKVSLFVSVRDKTGEKADEKATELAKDLADDVGRLRLKGVTAEVDPAVVAKEADKGYLTGPPGGVVVVGDPPIVRRVVVTISNPDPKGLAEAVNQVQREGAKYGPTDSPKVVYSRADDADDGTAAALGKATKKAAARAEAIAAGLGLKLGAVVAADEIPPTTPDVYDDGEVLRTVRVRVVYAVAK